MSLSCGCEIKGGMEVSNEMVKAHYKHTLEVVMVWGLLERRGENTTEEPYLSRMMKLHQATSDLWDAIEELYPEAKIE